ncbi:LRR receptor-like serine/threonine-protein kinase FLS2-like [Planoprotostelium fungivorum]|uniref:LRR receptor-like serine/threonine-protein kinase FLS2-like n=1 Tax=Planoprotostelium fungivorum TaxID=1890364 RepID=A0A2P6NR54_9EUKA|nr:LRR receptor-like serine/threonine-protein kinase FLS2-like [Planoprotostelium fungivorum]
MISSHLFVLLWLSFSHVALSTLATDDAAALKKVWQALAGNALYWKGTDPCNAADFTGVACGSGTYSIVLSQTLVTGGPLDPAIGSLGPRLLSLTAQTINLNGQLPVSICNLTNLNQLTISGNPSLGGVIPSCLTSLTALTSLTLSNNKLTGGIPSDISSLYNLKTLILGFNVLNGTIPNMSTMTNLTSLDVGYNWLINTNNVVSLPSSLLSLILTNCSISQPLMGLLNNTISLQKFNGAYNHWSGTISGISSLVNLTICSLSGNMSEISSLALLGILDINTNSFAGVVPPLNLSFLTSLNLGFNNLGGSLPPSVFFQPMLSTLDISNNNFTSIGFDSSHVSLTSTLATFSAPGNKYLTGSIPLLVGNYTKLTSMDLSFTLVTDTAPPYPPSMPVLNTVEVSDVTLFSTAGNEETAVPDSVRLIEFSKTDLWQPTGLRDQQSTSADVPLWSKWRLPLSLTTLLLSGNRIANFDPTATVGSSSLTSIDLSGGNLLTSFPDIRNLTALTTPKVEGNKLRTLFSNWNVPSLQSLTAQNNLITGPIPASLFTPQLKTLDLSYNQLNGSVPFPQLSNLTSVNLNTNLLTGVIPSVSGWAALQTIDLGINNFTLFKSATVGPAVTSCDMRQNPYLSCIPPSPCLATSTAIAQTLCPSVCTWLFTATNDVTKDFATAAAGCSNLTISLSGQFTSFVVNYTGYGSSISLVGSSAMISGNVSISLYNVSSFKISGVQFSNITNDSPILNAVGVTSIALSRTNFTSISAQSFLSVSNGLSLSLTNCIFSNNIATTAAISTSGTSPTTLSITSSTFSGNSAAADRRLCSNNVYYNNTASSNGGAVNTDGGVLSFASDTFTNNTANNNGGSIYGSGMTIITMISCKIVGSQAMRGGGIYSTGQLLVSQSNASSCAASTDGGFIWSSRTANLQGGSFFLNSAARGGVIFSTGAILRSNSASINLNQAAQGGAIYADQSTSTISACTFVNNSAPSQGGSIYSTGAMMLYSSVISSSESSAIISSGSVIQRGNRMYLYNNAGTIETLTGPSVLSNEYVSLSSSQPAIQLLQAAVIINNCTMASGGGITTSADDNSSLLTS